MRKLRFLLIGFFLIAAAVPPGVFGLIAGDINQDGVVNIQDFTLLSQAFGSTSSDADLNDDGVVNLLDFTILSNNFGLVEPTPTVTQVPSTPTATPMPPTPSEPSPTPPQTVGVGIWLSKEEIMNLPTSGSGWNNVQSAANNSVSSPNLQQRTSDNTSTLAKALVCARTGEHCAEARQILGQIIGTEEGGDILAVLRNTYAYVIAADLINLPQYDPQFNITFKSWLAQMRGPVGTRNCSHIIGCHERRANNFGGHAASSRIAIARYLGDTADLERAAAIHKGWMGDRSSYAEFSYGDLDWQCDPEAPVGVNRKDCVRSGLIIDGVIPDDQRRAGGFTTDPPCVNYVWGALQGYSVATQMLQRAGYQAWEWEDRAILRASVWLHSAEVKSLNWCTASGDETWVPFLINWYYGTEFPASPSVGKGMGFTDWTHQ